MNHVVIGTLAFDSIETPYDKRERAIGGSATYFAHAASKFGPVGLVGVVGQDFPDEVLEDFRGRGIDIEGVEHAEGESFFWAGRYEADWNTRHTLETRLNVFADFDPKLPESYRDADFVFLANGAPAIQRKALDQVRSPRLVVADTMNLWIDIARDELIDLLGRIDGLVLNDEEARMLTGEANLFRAAGKILEMGPKFIVLKKGEHGAFLFGEEHRFALPAYPVDNVVDPTGAGDSFAGGFMGYLAHTASLDPSSQRAAMLYGTVTASFCVEGFSTEEIGLHGRGAVDRRYDALRAFVTP
ncbi:MAG TPA: sugar kinase [Planctomycetes bacterium]|nr:sugar kinase [Planctomycetota bacterium]